MAETKERIVRQLLIAGVKIALAYPPPQMLGGYGKRDNGLMSRI